MWQAPLHIIIDSSSEANLIQNDAQFKSLGCVMRAGLVLDDTSRPGSG